MEVSIGSYTVRLTNNIGEFVKRRYDEVGMNVKEPSSSSFTIECLSDSKVVGSITIDMNPRNFACNKSYAGKLKELMELGSRPFEITKFVVERGEDFKWVSATLFNMLYRHCVIKRGLTHLVMECRPNHIAGYRRFFKFDVVDGPTYNQVVEGDVYFLVMDIEKTTGLKIN